MYGVRVATGMLLATLLAGCGAGAKQETVEFKSNGNPPASQAKSSAGASILDFTAPRLGGGQVKGSEFANKDLALWFWAPW